MKSVFETNVGVNAHLIKSVLASNDIDSEIFGEHLQGAMREWWFYSGGRGGCGLC